MKRPTDLLEDPDFLDLVRATHYSLEGVSEKVARGLGMTGSGAGRQLRAFGLTEECKVSPYWKAFRLAEETALAQADREKALAPSRWLASRLGIIGPRAEKEAAKTPLTLAALRGEMLHLSTSFSAFIARADAEIAEADGLSVDELLQLKSDTARHRQGLTNFEVRLEALCRGRGNGNGGLNP